MAMYSYAVEFSIMKGLGPDWETRIVEVTYDDVEVGTPEYEVKEWAKRDVENHLKRPGSEITKLVFVDIYET